MANSVIAYCACAMCQVHIAVLMENFGSEGPLIWKTPGFGPLIWKTCMDGGSYVYNTVHRRAAVAFILPKNLISWSKSKL